MKVHELKIWPEPFWAVHFGLKRHEFRRDDGRGFAVGDVLRLTPVEAEPPHCLLIAPPIEARVTYLTRGPDFGVPDGFVVMTIDPVMAVPR